MSAPVDASRVHALSISIESIETATKENLNDLIKARALIEQAFSLMEKTREANKRRAEDLVDLRAAKRPRFEGKSSKDSSTASTELEELNVVMVFDKTPDQHSFRPENEALTFQILVEASASESERKARVVTAVLGGIRRRFGLQNNSQYCGLDGLDDEQLHKLILACLGTKDEKEVAAVLCKDFGFSDELAEDEAKVNPLPRVPSMDFLTMQPSSKRVKRAWTETAPLPETASMASLSVSLCCLTSSFLDVRSHATLASTSTVWTAVAAMPTATNLLNVGIDKIYGTRSTPTRSGRPAPSHETKAWIGNLLSSTPLSRGDRGTVHLLQALLAFEQAPGYYFEYTADSTAGYSVQDPCEALTREFLEFARLSAHEGNLWGSYLHALWTIKHRGAANIIPPRGETRNACARLQMAQNKTFNAVKEQVVQRFAPSVSGATVLVGDCLASAIVLGLVRTRYSDTVSEYQQRFPSVQTLKVERTLELAGLTENKDGSRLSSRMFVLANNAKQSVMRLSFSALDERTHFRDIFDYPQFNAVSETYLSWSTVQQFSDVAARLKLQLDSW